MEIKTLEIRDRGTFIPVMAIRLGPRDEAERWLFGRAGYGTDPVGQGGYLVVVHLVDMKCHYSAHNWGSDTRTMPVAHQYMNDNWEDLTNGDVIDVEYILEETPTKKVSERLD